jgi:hypothetical protein
MGDVNINMANVDDNHTCMLTNLFELHHGNLLNKTPTTLYNSLLDHMWTNCPKSIPTYGSMYTPYSDHFLLWGTHMGYRHACLWIETYHVQYSLMAHTEYTCSIP